MPRWCHGFPVDVERCRRLTVPDTIRKPPKRYGCVAEFSWHLGKGTNSAPAKQYCGWKSTLFGSKFFQGLKRSFPRVSGRPSCKKSEDSGLSSTIISKTPLIPPVILYVRLGKKLRAKTMAKDKNLPFQATIIKSM